MLINSQFIQISNQYAVHLKLVLHVNYIAMKFFKIWIYLAKRLIKELIKIKASAEISLKEKKEEDEKPLEI